MRIGLRLARSPILAALAASALVAAGQPPAANPFAGKWTAEVRKHGKTQATKVVESGCSDLRFELRKEGDGLAGTMTGMDEDDEDLGTRRVVLTR